MRRRAYMLGAEVPALAPSTCRRFHWSWPVHSPLSWGTERNQLQGLGFTVPKAARTSRLPHGSVTTARIIDQRPQRPLLKAIAAPPKKRAWQIRPCRSVGHWDGLFNPMETTVRADGASFLPTTGIRTKRPSVGIPLLRPKPKAPGCCGVVVRVALGLDAGSRRSRRATIQNQNSHKRNREPGPGPSSLSLQNLSPVGRMYVSATGHIKPKLDHMSAGPTSTLIVSGYRLARSADVLRARR